MNQFFQNYEFFSDDCLMTFPISKFSYLNVNIYSLSSEGSFVS